MWSLLNGKLDNNGNSGEEMSLTVCDIRFCIIIAGAATDIHIVYILCMLLKTSAAASNLHCEPKNQDTRLLSVTSPNASALAFWFTVYIINLPSAEMLSEFTVDHRALPTSYDYLEWAVGEQQQRHRILRRKIELALAKLVSVDAKCLWAETNNYVCRKERRAQQCDILQLVLFCYQQYCHFKFL